MTTLQEFINTLPPERQERIAARSRELIAEEMTLQDLRKARELTQERMASMLNVDQVAISRLERRADMLLSTLQNHIRAMGGNLNLVVEFPNREPVILSGLGVSARREIPTPVR